MIDQDKANLAQSKIFLHYTGIKNCYYSESMNQKDQINRAQYESNLAMQQQQQQQQQPPQASAPAPLQQQGQTGQQGETRRASNVYGTQQNEQMIGNPYNPQIIQNQSFNQTQQSIPNIQQQTGINQVYYVSIYLNIK